MGESAKRWLLAIAGLACVGLAALGVILPGLPTTIFLIAASYLFARSCPYLEERLIRNRFFGPFLAYMDDPAAMPWRARVTAMAVMWVFVTASTLLLASRAAVPTWVVLLPPVAAVIGTWVIARLGAKASSSREAPSPLMEDGAAERAESTAFRRRSL